jgi:hypothetical protein
LVRAEIRADGEHRFLLLAGSEAPSRVTSRILPSRKVRGSRAVGKQKTGQGGSLPGRTSADPLGSGWAAGLQSASGAGVPARLAVLALYSTHSGEVLMLRGICLTVGLGAFLIPAGLRAEDTYTIKLRDPAKGDTLQVNRTEETQSQSKIVDAAGKTLVENEDKGGKVSVYRETVLEKPEGRAKPTRLKREYEKARVETKAKAEPLPYEGKTVLIEKKDAKFQFRVEGGEEIKGADARVLDEEFNKPDSDFDLQKAILPRAAVGTGESWKIDMEPITTSFAKSAKMQIDAAKAEGTGKLIKVYKKGDVEFGVLEFHLELPVKEIGEGKEKIALDAGAKWTMDITVDGCIDGSHTDGKMRATFKISAGGAVPLPDGTSAKLTTTGQGKFEGTAQEVKK